MSGKDLLLTFLMPTLIIVVLIFGLTQKCEDDKNLDSLENNSVYTVGTLTKVSFTGAASGNLIVFYEFEVDGNIIEGHQTIEEYCEFYYKCAKVPGYKYQTVGKLNCDVYYDSTKPANNKIELLKKYCK